MLDFILSIVYTLVFIVIGILCSLIVLSMGLFAILNGVYEMLAFPFRMLWLRSQLHHRGYNWVGLKDCFNIHKQHGWPARRIPDAEVLKENGYQEGDRATLTSAFGKFDRDCKSDEFLPQIFDYILIYVIIPCIVLISIKIVYESNYPTLGTVVLKMAYMIPILFVTTLALKSYLALIALRSKGYGWIGWEDALICSFKLRSNLGDIPPHNELALTPDYREYDVQSIIRFMQRSY